MNRTEKYKTVIRLSRPRSNAHFPMPQQDRAAQFAPFAALNGHSDEINETARYTDSMGELDENKISELDRILQRIAGNISTHPNVTVLYFCPDHIKSGGAYMYVSGKVKRIDEYDRTLVFEEGSKVKIETIFGVWYKE